MAASAVPPAPDEIERRVAETDTARSARRAATAREVGELARQHATIAEQLADIERQLAGLLAEADDVLTIDELARFTDVPATALTQWRANHKPRRAKRKNLSPPESQRNTPARTRGNPAPISPAPGQDDAPVS